MLQVGRSRDRFLVSLGIFPVAPDSSMCHGVDSDSKNEYQDYPGGKSGWCVRLTTYHLHVPTVKKSGVLNILEPCGPVQACNGTALPFYPSFLSDFKLNFNSDRFTKCTQIPNFMKIQPVGAELFHAERQIDRSHFSQFCERA